MRRHLGRTLAAASLAALVGLGCANDEQRAAKHIERAESYLGEGRPKEALLELRSALQLRPQDASINFKIASILDSNQEPAEAAFFFQEAYRLDPARSDAALSVARLVAYEETDRAEQLVAEVIQREPDNAEAYVLKSEVALIRGDADAALVAALAAVEFGPEEPRTHLQAGRVHQARVRQANLQNRAPEDAIFEAAVASFDRSAELAEGAAKFRALLERARIVAAWPGHQELAESSYRGLVEEARRSAKPEFLRDAARASVRYAEETKNQSFRIWSLEQLVEAEPELLDAWVELARAKQALDGSGETAFRRLLELRPDDAQAVRRFAVFLARNQQGDRAVAEVEQALARGVDPPLLLDFLSELHRQAGNAEASDAARERLRREYPDAPGTKLADARRLLEQGQLDQVVESMSALAKETNDVEALRLLAVAEIRRGGVEEARKALDRIFELDADPEATVYRLRSRVAFAEKRWSEVIDAMRILEQKRPPLSRQDRMILSKALREDGRKLAGQTLLEQMASGPKPYLPAIVELAQLEAETDPARARARLEAALEKAPDNPALLRELAAIDSKSGDPKQALARIDAAIASGQGGPRLLLDRAVVLTQLGDLAAAERDALQAFQADPTYSASGMLLVDIYSRQGKLEEAERSLEQARAAGALSTETQELLARIKIQLGREAEAVAILEKVVADRADAAGAKNDLAFLLAKQGTDLDRALRLAQEARAGLGDVAAVADTLGFVYLRKELYTPAADQFREALRLGGNDEPARRTYQYHLGMALRGLGRNAEAAEAFEAALAPGGDFGEAESARRELEEARRAASSAPSATP